MLDEEGLEANADRIVGAIRQWLDSRDFSEYREAIDAAIAASAP